jgi:putative heme iron utilization protein
MESTLDAEQAAAICAHMNDDHADAVAGYARTYGSIADVVAAEMVSLDSAAMELAVTTTGERIVTRIAFDHLLRDTDDARTTLIAMARGATTHS